MFSKSIAVLILGGLCLSASYAAADVLCEDNGKLLIFRGVNVCSGGLKQIDMNDFAKVKAGPAGSKGDVGPKGARGATGSTGKTGSKGDSGVKGDGGIKGANGAQGDIGPQGARGAQGDRGAKGPKRLTGAQGDKGPKGDGGGTTGPKGNPGPDGDETGLKGARGPAGDAGQEGHALQWREAIVPQVCEEKNPSGVIDGGSTYDATTKNTSVEFSCNTDQFLYQYSFNAYGKLGQTLKTLAVAPSVTFVEGRNYIDRIQANVTLKLIDGIWETANYSTHLICCKINPVPSVQ